MRKIATIGLLFLLAAPLAASLAYGQVRGNSSPVERGSPLVVDSSGYYTLAGNGIIVGSLQTTGVDERIYGTTYITELLDFNTYPDKLHLSPALAVDNSVYVGIGISGANTTSLYIRQPDGGCSKCGVDAAGTTWACTNATTCASVGM